LRAELQRALERVGEGARTMAALAEDLETVRRQARNQATRIRLRALREAAVLGERVAELEGAPGGSRERLMGRLEEAIERVGAEDDEEALAALATSNGHAEREVGELFDGLVEVEVGPLSDFSQLVGLEDAASEIGAASEISVKRFTGGRATLAMRFKHPVELLRELEERAPFEFRVRDTRSNRIELDMDEKAPARAALPGRLGGYRGSPGVDGDAGPRGDRLRDVRRSGRSDDAPDHGARGADARVGR
jgi:hypothetical protein